MAEQPTEVHETKARACGNSAAESFRSDMEILFIWGGRQYEGSTWASKEMQNLFPQLFQELLKSFRLKGHHDSGSKIVFSLPVAYKGATGMVSCSQ